MNPKELVHPGPDPRRHILDVAEQMFAERGYVGTSLQAIAAAVGYSKSAVLYYFSSKAEMLRELLRPGMDALIALERSLAPLTDGEAQDAAITGMVDMAMRYQFAVKVFPGAPRSLGMAPELADLNMREVGFGLLDAMCGRSGSETDLAIAIMVILGMPQAIVEMNALPDDVLRDTLVGAARRALNAPGA